MKRISLVLALALAVATAAYGAAAASANHGHSLNAHSLGKGLSHRATRGTVASVASDSITLNLRKGGTATFTVTGDTKVRRNGKKVAITDLLFGDRAVVIRGKDGNAKKVLAQSRRVYNGTVAGVDTNLGTITLTLKKGGPATFTVNQDTMIIVNDQPGQLSDIQVGWHSNVKVADDGTTATRVEADNETDSD